MRKLEENLMELEKYIVDYNAENNYLPSIREMASHLDIKSTSTISYYLKELEKNGVIKRNLNTKNKARCFEIVKKESEVEEFAFPYDEYNVNIPLIGQVTAGEPIFAVENYEDTFPFSKKLFRGDNLFMLRVIGKSMIEAGIMPNDYIVVQKQNTAQNGEIVVALVDDSATVKTFYKEKDYVILQPRNSSMQPIIVKEVEILGKVVGVIRTIR